MAKYKHNYKVREYNLDYKPGETDLQYYKRLAKVADQRLLRLEELAGMREGIPATPGYEKVTKYAYERAMRDLEIYGGGNRFNTKPPLNPDGTVDNRLLSEKLADIRTFLSSVSSTKQGIQQVYSERARTFNEQFGTNYTWQDLADFYQSGDADKALRHASSETIQRAIGVIQKAQSKLQEEIKQNKKITLDKKKDKIVYNKAMELLESSDLNLSILKDVNKKDIGRLKQIVKEIEKEKTT